MSADGNALQPVGNNHDGAEAGLHPLAGSGAVSPPVSGTGPARFPAGGARANDDRTDTDVLLTVREVAATLKVSTATVYKLVDRGVLEAVNVAGAFVRVRRSVLRDVVAQRARR